MSLRQRLTPVFIVLVGVLVVTAGVLVYRAHEDPMRYQQILLRELPRVSYVTSVEKRPLRPRVDGAGPSYIHGTVARAGVRSEFVILPITVRDFDTVERRLPWLLPGRREISSDLFGSQLYIDDFDRRRGESRREYDRRTRLLTDLAYAVCRIIEGEPCDLV